MYWNGAELVGSYPVSIPFENQATQHHRHQLRGLAWTSASPAAAQTVPHLQRLLGYLEESLAELEKEILVD